MSSTPVSVTKPLILRFGPRARGRRRTSPRPPAGRGSVATSGASARQMVHHGAQNHRTTPWPSSAAASNLLPSSARSGSTARRNAVAVADPGDGPAGTEPGSQPPDPHAVVSRAAATGRASRSRLFAIGPPPPSGRHAAGVEPTSGRCARPACPRSNPAHPVGLPLGAARRTAGPPLRPMPDHVRPPRPAGRCAASGTDGAATPTPEPMIGRYCHVVRLDPEAHGEPLFEANGVDAEGSNWTYLPCSPFDLVDDYLEWLRRMAALSDPMSMPCWTPPLVERWGWPAT